MNAVHSYYATPGPLSALDAHGARVRELPEGLAELCGVVQGLVVHPFLAHLYGLEPGAVRQAELELRPVADMLMADPHESGAAELALLDRVAALTLAGDERHAERLALQASEPGLRVPAHVISFNLGGAKVALGPGVAN